MAPSEQPRSPGISTLETNEAPSTSTPTALWVAVGLVIPGLLAFCMATMNETQVFAVVLGILGVGVILARPFWGLIVFVALLYARPEENIPALGAMHFTLLVSVVTLVAMVFTMLLNREPMVRTPLNGMIAGFGIIVVLSTMSHGNTSEAAMDIGKLVILVFMVTNLVTTPARYRQFAQAMLCFTGYLALYSIYLYYNGGAYNEHGLERAQATGIFADPNDMAASIVAGLALVLLFIRQAKGLLRTFYVALAGVMIFATLLTNSRGGMLALIAVVGGYMWLFSKRKAVVLPAMVVVVAVLMALGGSHMTNFDSDEESANSRFWFWDNGVTQLVAAPMTGVGYDGFPDVNNGMTAHNSFVLCFAELGLPGYFFWIGCFYTGYRRRSILDPTALKAEPETTVRDARAPGRQRPRLQGNAGGDADAAPMVAPVPTGESDAAPADTSEADLLERVRVGQQCVTGARLAVSGFLVACFWISRTYTPVMYLLMTLPVSAQVAHRDPSEPPTLKAYPGDNARIAWICLFSILAIKLIAARSK